ncbi:PAS domain-containing sensor histidine kinase [Brevibacillus choshinensis]|uniref:histidine kinase n=1 Tax=Brevibacillus choshinensis TaxID=54911 RepID=A0ABX7FLV2_BRECH|nr:PAS domain-containing sensor histidine kinase [Brevibacillus choshinensis]QRG67234.1 PAS domain S-box protein [Brevibacillus choshinensis]
MAKLTSTFTWKKKPSIKVAASPLLSDQLLNAFFHHTTDAISFSDMDNNLILVNQAFEHYYGWTIEELKETPYCFIPPELIQESQQLFEAVRTMGVHLTNYETIRQRKDGSFVDINLTSAPVFDEHGTIIGISCTARDISERKKAEEALRETEAKYRLLIDHTQDIVTIYTPTMERIYISPSVEEHLGYSAAEFHPPNRLQLIHPDDEALLREYHQLILTTKQHVQFETRSLNKDGFPVAFETRGVPILNKQGHVENIMFVSRNVMERKSSEAALLKSEEINRIIAEHTDDLIMITDKMGGIIYLSPSHERVIGRGKPLSLVTLDDVHPEDRHLIIKHFQHLILSQKPGICEFRFQCASGKWIVLESKGVPIMTGQGECDGFIVVSRDITERKHNEDLLRKAEKLSMIGELAAGIAHEIRNPLTSLKGFIQLLYPSLQENKLYADIMLSELERINFIVSELLVLAKPQNVQIKPLSLVGLLQNVLALLSSEANLKNIRFQTSFGKCPLIAGEENQLKQVFINIIKNSIEAISGHGEIRVSTRLLPNRHILVRLADNGCGVSEELIAKLGEPFFTTKEKGTGLGLMISSKIIKDHNGSFEITSKKNRGTVVKITLPIAEDQIGPS